MLKIRFVKTVFYAKKKEQGNTNFRKRGALCVFSRILKNNENRGKLCGFQFSSSEKTKRT